MYTGFLRRALHLTCIHAYGLPSQKWTKLSGEFPGRTENGVKNRFHSAHFKVWCNDKGYAIREDSRKVLIHDSSRSNDLS